MILGFLTSRLGRYALIALAIVAALGATAAFANNALFYLPLLIVLFLWRRVREPSRLPPERLVRAVVSGVRYISYSLPIRVVLIRTMVTGVLGGSILALMPIVARDLLNGNAQDYGVMYGRSFEDPDGHIWEPSWMDPAVASGEVVPSATEA